MENTNLTINEELVAYFAPNQPKFDDSQKHPLLIVGGSPSRLFLYLIGDNENSRWSARIEKGEGGPFFEAPYKAILEKGPGFYLANLEIFYETVETSSIEEYCDHIDKRRGQGPSIAHYPLKGDVATFAKIVHISIKPSHEDQSLWGVLDYPNTG